MKGLFVLRVNLLSLPC